MYAWLSSSASILSCECTDSCAFILIIVTAPSLTLPVGVDVGRTGMHQRERERDCRLETVACLHRIIYEMVTARRWVVVVFWALNRVELFMLLFISVVLQRVDRDLILRSVHMQHLLPLDLVAILLVLQVIWLQPALDGRACRIITTNVRSHQASTSSVASPTAAAAATTSSKSTPSQSSSNKNATTSSSKSTTTASSSSNSTFWVPPRTFHHHLYVLFECIKLVALLYLGTTHVRGHALLPQTAV